MHGIPIGRIAGFPVKVDWGVLVILWLFTWSLASTLPTTAEGFSTRTYSGGRRLWRRRSARIIACPRACACDPWPGVPVSRFSM